MSNRNILLEIVDTLEVQGLDRDEYQLHRTIDVEALEQLIDSANGDLEVRFSLGEIRLCVTQFDVQVLPDQ